ncbi:MAG: nickel-dependent lactate racemase [Candidatus Geothermarchaeales archaeon]
MMDAVKVSLPYGGRLLECEFPERNLLTIAEPPFGVPVEDEQRSIRQAITKAIHEGELSTTLKPTDKVTIAVTDSTRPTPNSKILPILLDELGNFGVKDENVAVIIATGMHEPDSLEEMRRNVGEEALRRVKVVNHNPDDREHLVSLGRTELGTEMEVNKLFADADVRVTTGTIGPCMLVGWSGGGKTVMPGVSSRRSIDQNHTLFVRNVRKAKRGAMFGLIEDNWVRRDIDDYAQRVGVDLIVNTVQNAKEEILGVYAGGLPEAYGRTLEHAKKAMTAPVSEKADVVVVSPGVYSHEVSLYQSGSRMFASVEGLVEKGGTIILVSSCYKGIYEGIEKEEFKRTLLQYRDPEEVLELTEKGEIPSFESCISYQFVWMMKHFTIMVVTDGVSKEELKEMGMEHAPTISKALETSLSWQGRDATVTVVPYGDITYTGL